MNIALPMRLTVDEFLAWAVRQQQGKYELVDGAVVEEPRQNWGHTKTRLQVQLALREAISEGPPEFYVAPNGPTVRVSDDTAFLPDALLAPLPSLHRTASRSTIPSSSLKSSRHRLCAWIPSPSCAATSRWPACITT